MVRVQDYDGLFRSLHQRHLDLRLFADSPRIHRRLFPFILVTVGEGP